MAGRITMMAPSSNPRNPFGRSLFSAFLPFALIMFLAGPPGIRAQEIKPTGKLYRWKQSHASSCGASTALVALKELGLEKLSKEREDCLYDQIGFSNKQVLSLFTRRVLGQGERISCHNHKDPVIELLTLPLVKLFRLDRIRYSMPLEIIKLFLSYGLKVDLFSDHALLESNIGKVRRSKKLIESLHATYLHSLQASQDLPGLQVFDHMPTFQEIKSRLEKGHKMILIEVYLGGKRKGSPSLHNLLLRQVPSHSEQKSSAQKRGRDLGEQGFGHSKDKVAYKIMDPAFGFDFSYTVENLEKYFANGGPSNSTRLSGIIIDVHP